VPVQLPAPACLFFTGGFSPFPPSLERRHVSSFSSLLYVVPGFFSFTGPPVTTQYGIPPIVEGPIPFPSPEECYPVARSARFSFFSFSPHFCGFFRPRIHCDPCARQVQNRIFSPRRCVTRVLDSDILLLSPFQRDWLCGHGPILLEISLVTNQRFS